MYHNHGYFRYVCSVLWLSMCCSRGYTRYMYAIHSNCISKVTVLALVMCTVHFDYLFEVTMCTILCCLSHVAMVTLDLRTVLWLLLSGKHSFTRYVYSALVGCLSQVTVITLDLCIVLWLPVSSNHGFIRYVYNTPWTSAGDVKVFRRVCTSRSHSDIQTLATSHLKVWHDSSLSIGSSSLHLATVEPM